MLVKLEARYELPAVGATLSIDYTIDATGRILYQQAMKAGSKEKVANLFRFGIKMELPQTLDQVSFYGRGPVESYPDRKLSQPFGYYQSSVADQFYPYIRPQETGLHSDLSYFRVLDRGGRGLELRSDQLFMASALDRSMESLDGYPQKGQEHSEFIAKAPFTQLLADSHHMGLGCYDSWGALPQPKYLLPYQDYSLTLLLTPVLPLRPQL